MAIGKVSDLGKNLIKSIQTVTGTYPQGTINVPIAAIDLNKAFISSIGYVGNGFGLVKAKFTSATNVRLDMADGNGQRTIVIEVTEYR